LVSTPAAEASLGYRDGFSLHLAANAVVPLLTAKSYRPYAGMGATLYTERWLSGLDLGLHLLLGAERDLGRRGTAFVEYGAVDFFNQHRLLVGYRLAF